jgi:hypothetical protein
MTTLPSCNPSRGYEIIDSVETTPLESLSKTVADAR